MPRRPNGDRAMTSTERGRLYRERHSDPLARLVAAWHNADSDSRQRFLAHIAEDECQPNI